MYFLTDGIGVTCFAQRLKICFNFYSALTVVFVQAPQIFLCRARHGLMEIKADQFKPGGAIRIFC